MRHDMRARRLQASERGRGKRRWMGAGVGIRVDADTDQGKLNFHKRRPAVSS